MMKTMQEGQAPSEWISDASGFEHLTSREIELLADGLRSLPEMGGDADLIESLLARLDSAQAMR